MKLKNLSILSILFFGNYAMAQTGIIFKSGFEFFSPLFVPSLNDTGITWAGEYPSGTNVDCPSTTSGPQQDCHTGRDVTHYDETDGHAGFSFIKLDTTGTALADQSVEYTTTPWVCVQDNVTGLVWEVKTITAGIHNEDNTYRWGGATAIGLGDPAAEDTYFNDWDVLVNDSNAETLCGYNNWHVPSPEELSGLVNQGTFDPSIDTNYFPNTASSKFWSSSPTVGFSNFAWSVSFNYGIVDIYDRGSSYHVRLVRSIGP